MEESLKPHKKKSKKLPDLQDLVSDQSLEKNYKILGKVFVCLNAEKLLNFAKCMKQVGHIYVAFE